MKTPFKIFLFVGAALLITGLLAFTPFKAGASTCVEWHVVHSGESLQTIARDYGMSVQELINLNHLRNPRYVEEGTYLCISTDYSSGQDDPHTSKAYSYPSYDDHDCDYPEDCDYVDEDCYYPEDCDYEDHDCYYPEDCDYDDHDCYQPEDCDYEDHDCYLPEDCDYEDHGNYYPEDCDYDDHDCYHYGYSDDAIRDWNFEVIRVREDRDVTIQANSFPHNVTFDVEMRYDGGEWVYSDHFSSGGSFKLTVPIPHQLRGYSPLVIRVTEFPDAVADQETFANHSYTASTYGGKTYAKHYYKYEYEGIPTIWIERVVRDKSVTFRTHNFPPYLEFNVYMGEMGTKGKGGYYAGDFYSGPGGTFYVTVAIPSQLKGEPKIAIRTESEEKGYFSYNWFNNKTAN